MRHTPQSGPGRLLAAGPFSAACSRGCWLPDRLPIPLRGVCGARREV